jgi:hypothetical protein
MSSNSVRAKTGNRFVIKFDGQAIGVCKSIDMRDEMGLEPVTGIGSINAFEYVPTLARHTISVEEIIMDSDSLMSLGLVSENGTAALEGKIFDIEATDDTGASRKYLNCSYASGSISIRGNALLVSNATFNAIDVSGKMM